MLIVDNLDNRDEGINDNMQALYNPSVTPPALKTAFTVALSVVIITFVGTSPGVAQESAAKPTAEQLQFFERDIRPLLVNRCQKCHGKDKQQGHLRLDSLAALLAGGDSGPAAVPGQPAESLLIQAVGYEGAIQMPPSGKLKPEEIDLLTQWVAMGLPWTNSVGDEKSPLVPRKGDLPITEDDRAFWSFQPPRRPPVPAVRQSDWPSNPLDRFILQKIEEQGLIPSPPASPRELARRLYFDLIGLPPTLEELDEFLRETAAPAAYERLVDDLLARPQFGERWGRHWLDLVRYAQTNGYERDDEKPQAWRYRDYVIRALNEDKPYDQFVIEQLAGDELDQITDDSLTATGFYRLGVWDDEPDDRVQARFDELDDILHTTSATFMGLTVACARCHDHKFDPIPHEDYYKLLSFFQNISLYGSEINGTHYGINKSGIFTPLVTLPVAEQWRTRRSKMLPQLKPLEEKLNALNQEDEEKKKASEEERKSLEEQINHLKGTLQNPPFPHVLSIRENPPATDPLAVLIRGNPQTPGKTVETGFLQVLSRSDWNSNFVSLPQGDDERKQALQVLEVIPTSGRRRALAEWLVSPRHPLTARVIVNRLWQHHFGRGLVPTPSDFGRTGEPPSHPELLDWLACELQENGWSLKHIHRLILTSSTYRQSSRIAQDAAVAVDPANHLLWRQNLRRLEAEVIRDSVLAVSGSLNPQMTGRGIFPLLPPEVLSTQSRPGNGWDKSDEFQRSRRSIYIFVKRTLGVPLMEAFDAPISDNPGPNRSVTTIAPQALMLLNSEFLEQHAGEFAVRLINECGDDRDTQIKRAVHITLGRQPTDNELNQARGFMDRQTALSQSASLDASANIPALAAFCKLLMNLNEFVYVD
ncbi:MAG: PSD1 and planctomycete cytochrome C domain-containing protein [Planctomycetaceae bacterium]